VREIPRCHAAGAELALDAGAIGEGGVQPAGREALLVIGQAGSSVGGGKTPRSHEKRAISASHRFAVVRNAPG
jgi:hypothetical protein